MICNDGECTSGFCHHVAVAAVSSKARAKGSPPSSRVTDSSQSHNSTAHGDVAGAMSSNTSKACSAAPGWLVEDRRSARAPTRSRRRDCGTRRGWRAHGSDRQLQKEVEPVPVEQPGVTGHEPGRSVEVDVHRPMMNRPRVRRLARSGQRNGRDSNPRAVRPPLSRRVPMSALPPFRRPAYRLGATGGCHPRLMQAAGGYTLRLRERCQSGRMGRPAKALTIVRWSVGSNPTLSASNSAPARMVGAESRVAVA